MIKYIYKVILNKKNKNILFIQMVLIALGAVASVYPIRLIQKIVDMAASGNVQAIPGVILTGGIYLAIQIANTGISAFIRYLTGYIQADLSFHLQKEVFCHMKQIPLREIKFSDSTAMSNTILQDTEYVSENIAGPFAEFVSSVLTFLFGFYFVSQISVYMAFMILPLGLITSTVMKYISKRSFENLALQREQYTKLWKIFYEGILGFLPLRFHCTAEKYYEKIVTDGEKLKKILITQKKIESASGFANSALFMATIGIIMIVSSVLVLRGQMTLGGLTAVMMYNHMLSDPLLKIQELNHKIQKLKVSFGRVYDILSIPSDRVESLEETDEIELVHAGFCFKDREILKDINFHIVKGEAVMISGHTGVGKSTLVNMIAGIYDCSSGAVLFKRKGKKIQGRPRISYMLQDEYIFDDTVINNILVGNPDLSEEELEKIISICELEGIAGKLENVGDNGSRLSGGERKRLVIARTIADAKADVVIFDEFSASLDTDTFLRIWKRVDQYEKDKIRIYIEHNMQIQGNVKYKIILK